MGFRVSREELDKAPSGDAWYDRPIEKGVHKAKITAGNMEPSKSTGNEMIHFVIDTQEVPKEKAPEGQVKFHYYVASAWGARNFLEALCPEALATSDIEVEIEPEDFIGAECRVKVTLEKYEGQLRPKVASLLPLEAPTPAPAAAPAQSAAATTTSAPTTPAAALSGRAGLNDEELPF